VLGDEQLKFGSSSPHEAADRRLPPVKERTPGTRYPKRLWAVGLAAALAAQTRGTIKTVLADKNTLVFK
jgi:hypothetical protein